MKMKGGLFFFKLDTCNRHAIGIEGHEGGILNDSDIGECTNGGHQRKKKDTYFHKTEILDMVNGLMFFPFVSISLSLFKGAF